MKWLRHHLTLGSRLRYAAWRLLGGTRRPFSGTLQNGLRIVLRPPPTTDLAVAAEIFVYDMYRPPAWLRPETVRTLVDVGGNIGLSCCYWLKQFPQAQITTYEPHPDHVAQIWRQAEANGALRRITIFPAAAGTAPGTAWLMDDGCRSRVIFADPKPGDVPIPVDDWVGRYVDHSIDFLKMDIEGGEFPILADPRFGRIRARALVLEWHVTPEHPDAEAWCVGRLEELGYEVTRQPLRPDNGLLWARRKDPT